MRTANKFDNTGTAFLTIQTECGKDPVDYWVGLLVDLGEEVVDAEELQERRYVQVCEDSHCSIPKIT